VVDFSAQTQCLHGTGTVFSPQGKSLCNGLGQPSTPTTNCGLFRLYRGGFGCSNRESNRISDAYGKQINHSLPDTGFQFRFSGSLLALFRFQFDRAAFQSLFSCLVLATAILSIMGCADGLRSDVRIPSSHFSEEMRD
jgi:hypothetical protein